MGDEPGAKGYLADGVPGAMAHWLVKEEPTHYSFEDLVRDGRTEWDGVHNALALRHLRSMRPGEEGFYYHSGDVRSIVGVIAIAGAPHPSPEDPRGSWAVAVRPVRALARPVALAEIKADPAFSGFDLVRIGRLSIVPVADAWWKRILRMSDRGAPAISRSGLPRPRKGSSRPRAAGSRRGVVPSR